MEWLISQFGSNRVLLGTIAILMVFVIVCVTFGVLRWKAKERLRDAGISNIISRCTFYDLEEKYHYVLKTRNTRFLNEVDYDEVLLKYINANKEEFKTIVSKIKHNRETWDAYLRQLDYLVYMEASKPGILYRYELKVLDDMILDKPVINPEFYIKLCVLYDGKTTKLDDYLFRVLDIERILDELDEGVDEDGKTK